MTETCRDHRQVPNSAGPQTDWLLLALFAIPLGIAVAKIPGLPTAAVCARFFSLADLPAHFQASIENVLLVPVGAVVVVLFRLTLGIRVLGLFRPILMAMAFEIIGIPVSLTFVLFALVIVVALRPLLNTDHSYSRLAVLLSLAAALLFAPLMVGRWWDISWFRQIALFPVIALCLTCESFAKVLHREGIREAVWRTLTTLFAAGIIVGVMRLPGVTDLFLRFPEFLLAQAGCILLINRCLAFRLFEGANPLEWSFDTAAQIGSQQSGPLDRREPRE